DEYPVAINLADAIKNPGGKNDIVLREDDRLEIPVFNNTVRVTGAVMMPNAVAYNSMYTAKKYVRLCGGFSQKAKKSNAYIVSMNGSARPYVGNTRLKPGDEIVVPQKGEKKISDIQAISSLAGAVSSVSSLLVSVALILRYTN
ncbi:MAG: capsule biosynthesis protein, partial [Bacteroidales bacterium]|nr:capsule biosynthesis protein [Bacteroidales bacterium]